MKHENYKKVLPEGYVQIFSINAKDTKIGIMMNLCALLIGALVMGLSYLVFVWSGIHHEGSVALEQISLACFLFAMVMVVYLVLHELVHGLAYKSLTGEKLTFGMSWSCAFCGVPHIFVTRKVSLIASAAPLLLFTLLFIPLMILFLFLSPVLYFFVALLFAIHLGGCAGDAYIIYLLLFRYRSPRVLVKDTGPEQTFYVPSAER